MSAIETRFSAMILRGLLASAGFVRVKLKPEAPSDDFAGPWLALPEASREAWERLARLVAMCPQLSSDVAVTRLDAINGSLQSALAQKQARELPTLQLAEKLRIFADDLESEGRSHAPAMLREAASRLDLHMGAPKP